MDILICNGKLTSNKSSKLSFNVLFRTLYHYAYTLKTVNLPSTVLSWCAVTPKWCFELHGRLKRKLVKMQKRLWKIQKLHDTWTRQWELACEHYTHKHTRAHTQTHACTQACTQRTVSEAQSGSHRTHTSLWKHHLLKGSASPRELVMAINAAATVYSLLSMWWVSQLVLHNHDLILFFQQPYLVSYNTILQIRKQRYVLSPDYHMTLKKAVRSFISTSHLFLKGKLPNVSRNQIWVYIRSVNLFQGIYDWNLENTVFI